MTPPRGPASTRGVPACSGAVHVQASCSQAPGSLGLGEENMNEEEAGVPALFPPAWELVVGV